jgi:hypothetical protein
MRATVSDISQARHLDQNPSTAVRSGSSPGSAELPAGRWWRRALRALAAGYAQTSTPRVLWLPGIRPWCAYGPFLSTAYRRSPRWTPSDEGSTDEEVARAIRPH